jgi:uncharacterized protein DUF4157
MSAPTRVSQEVAARAPRRSLDASRPAPTAVHPALRVQRLAGNRAFGCLQAKLTISQPGDAYEIEADSVADQVMRMPELQVQRTCACGGTCDDCQEDEAKSVQRATEMPASSAAASLPQAPPVVEDVLRCRGEPLDSSTLAFMETRFGHDFAPIRVHHDRKASGSARAIDARAYTVGEHVVFGEGQHRPGTTEGQRLLAHELTHVVQQGAGSPSSRGDVLQRQPNSADPSEPAPPVSLPGGVTLFPGPLRPGLLGAPIPLPASIRVTNALGLGPGPTFIVDVAPRLLLGHIMQSVDLVTWTRPGTPSERAGDPASQARISLVNPTVTLDPASGRIRGWATLSVGSDYPLRLKDPTDIAVAIESTRPGAFTGDLQYGPVVSSFELSLHYDTGRLEQALTSTRGGQEGVSSALSAVGSELTHPGFTLSGGLRLRLPGRGSLPLSSYHAEAPTTTPLAHRLLSAPAPFPLTYSAGGIILAPPGGMFDFAVPAFGYTRSSFGERSGYSATAALLPTLSPRAISAREPFGNQFPVYAYVELSYVRRVSRRLDLGARLVIQQSTISPVPTPTDPAVQLQQALQHYREASAPGGPEPSKPNIGITLFGQFDVW